MKKLLLFFLTIISLRGFGQDLRGAYLRSSWLSGFTYSVNVTLLTEASMNLARPTVSVNFGDNSIGLLGLGTSATSNGVTVKNYSVTHTYSGTGSYIVSNSDTFRVAAITNMLNSQVQPLYVESRIYSAGTRTPNSAPVLSTYPVLFGTVGTPLQYNPGCTDADGDSLSYLLTNCSGANYTVPNVTIFDNNTGLLIFSPSSPGRYAFTFFIHEWRGSPAVMVGSSQLDFIADISAGVGIPETPASGSVKTVVYPNPVSNELRISVGQENCSNCSFELFNSLGQIVLKTYYQDKLDVSDLPKGMYLLKMSGNISEPLIKFIKD